MMMCVVLVVMTTFQQKGTCPSLPLPLVQVLIWVGGASASTILSGWSIFVLISTCVNQDMCFHAVMKLVGGCMAV